MGPMRAGPERTADTVPLRILVYGHYGRRNCGDDAMLFCLLRELGRRLPDAAFVIPTRGPCAIPEELRARTQTVPHNAHSIFRAILSCRVLVVAGGTQYQDFGPRRLVIAIGKHVLLVTLCRVLRRKVLLAGVGIGPLNTRIGRSLMRLILACTDAVFARDGSTGEVVRDLSASTAVFDGFDLAALLPGASCALVAPGRPSRARVLGVSVLEWGRIWHSDGELDTLLQAALARELRRLLESRRDIQIVLFGFSADKRFGDGRASRALADLVGNESRVKVLEYAGDPGAWLHEVARCDAFLAMRYHACVFAYLAGLPMAILAYHPKCVDLAQQIGLPAGGVIDPLEVARVGSFPKVDRLFDVSAREYRALMPLRAARDLARGYLQSAAEEICRARKSPVRRIGDQSRPPKRRYGC